MAEIIRLNQIDETNAALFSVEAEQQVLGALLLDNERVGGVVLKGGASLFYEPLHAEIFKRICDLEKAEILANPVTLREWFTSLEGSEDLGGAPYLARLAAGAVVPNQIGSYCDHLGELAARRKVMAAMDDARNSIAKGEETAAHVAGRLEAALFAMEGGKAPKTVSMLSAVTEAAQMAWGAYKGEERPGVETGINALDALLGAMYPGDLILLGGRPSMGKTAAAISITLNAARAGNKIAFASLEMGPEAIAMRCLSESMAGRGRAVSYRDLRAGEFGQMHEEALAEAMQEVGNLPVQFLPQEFQDVGAILAGVRRAKSLMGGLDMIVVDYAQLMKASQAKSRYEVMTEVSTALKRLAVSMRVPVLALSQLSRQVEQRDNKRPQMADLRESGQLEQDADTVLFCYRDEYYIEREKPEDPEQMGEWQAALEGARNRLEIIVAKQRQGAIGTADVFCNVALNRIWER